MCILKLTALNPVGVWNAHIATIQIAKALSNHNCRMLSRTICLGRSLPSHPPMWKESLASCFDASNSSTSWSARGLNWSSGAYPFNAVMFFIVIFVDHDFRLDNAGLAWGKRQLMHSSQSLDSTTQELNCWPMCQFERFWGLFGYLWPFFVKGFPSFLLLPTAGSRSQRELRNLNRELQIPCRRECQHRCQIECQKECQTECQQSPVLFRPDCPIINIVLLQGGAA